MYKIKLSPYAKIFYNEWLINSDSSLYNIVIDQILYGELDVKRLRNALKNYVNNHVILNSHILNINGEPCWIKNDSINELEYLDNSIDTSSLLHHVNRSFNLCGEPLYRFRLLRVEDNIYRLILVFHHIVIDGSSTEIGVFEAISNYYDNEGYTLKYNTDVQVKLITNLTEMLSGKLEKSKDKYKEFWDKKLADIEAIDLKFLKLNKTNNECVLSEMHNHIGEIRFSYEETELAKLSQIKRKYVITPYLYGQCIFALLIHRYTDYEQLVISYAIPIKGGVDFIYGAQVNTNLIPYKFSQSTTIKELFNQSREFFDSLKFEDINFGYYPITEIIREKNKHLLDLCFIQPHFKDSMFKFNGINKVEICREFNIDSVNPFLFEQELRNKKLNYRVRYDKRIINEELLNNFVTSFKKLFLEVLEDLIHGNDSKSLSNYSLLDPKQFKQIVYGSSKIECFPQDKTIHRLFEEQVLKTPDNTAIVYEDIKLTYQELNQKANQLANYLHRNYDIKPDDLIVLCLDKNEQMLVAMLAVLKASGAYVPISPDLPDNRIRYVLKDTKAKIVLTNRKYQKRLMVEDNKIIVIDAGALQNELSNERMCNLQIPMVSSNLIYVIYTSGTTGDPKGVLQQHNNVMRLFTATDSWYHFTDKDVWVLFHSYVFDFTVWEVWGALLYGGKLIIPTTEQTRDTNLFYKLCDREKITVLNQTPQAFYNLMDIATTRFKGCKLSHLKYIIFGGETLNFSKLRSWLGLYGYKQPKLINMYGITETTVHVSYKEIKEEDIGHDSYIGVAIPDQKLLVLDVNLLPLPIGGVGELYVGGAGLARGYLNNLKLSQKKFIPNPFQTAEEKALDINYRLYKTGDLVRKLPDESFEYIGRNDLQVKIRGYRIELGEIENKLINYPGIKQAIVMAKEHVSIHVGSSKNLIAYYVADKKADELKLQNYLAKQLPRYMLPSMFIYLKKLPISLNGKLDRKALPEPKFESTDKYEVPNNKREGLICQEFAKILGLEKTGINDDFFELGGDSLKAIALVSALQANLDIKVADIFNLRTPKKIAENSYLAKNMLKQKLEQVKLSYKNKRSKGCLIDNKLQNKLDRYYDSVNNMHIECSVKKSISNVLLTGATGYLGCNILNQLLKLTDYNIFLLIRADSHIEAVNRINKKFQFYFSKTLDDVINLRVFVIKADIENNNLGLLPEEYQVLATKVDCVIHAAAMVKHYGEYDKFYSANVQATVNMLELARLTKSKDFHYISTYSVLNLGFISDGLDNSEKRVYIENDLSNNFKECQNVYIQTKIQGEQQTIKYRKCGVKSNIYRIGNLAFMSENYRMQQNADDNAFFNWLKCILKMKCIAQDIRMVEISQVDLAAQAIVKLFDKEQLTNNIYHVFNHNLFDVSSAFMDSKTPIVKTLSIEQFIDTIIYNLNNNIYPDLIARFLLHQGWLDGLDIRNTTYIQVLQNKTKLILEQLGFKWLPITGATFNRYIRPSAKGNYGMMLSNF